MNRLSALQRFSASFSFLHRSNKLEISLSLLYMCKRGNIEIPLTKSSKQSSWVCWKTLTLLWCVDRSCTSTLLLIRESTIWIAKTSPHTRLPGFFCPIIIIIIIIIYIFTADLSKTLRSAVTLKKKVESLGFEGALCTTHRCAVIQFTKEL